MQEREEKRVSVTGLVENIIYQNSENGYTVLSLSADKSTHICVGIMPDAAKGECLDIKGVYDTHKTHGVQIRVQAYERKLPEDASSILRYLASGAVKGIGAALAAKIVAKFGKDAFDVIENHHTWLAEIPGISRAKAEIMHKSFCERSDMRRLMMFCEEHLTPVQQVKIYKQWGGRAIDVISANPYRLAAEISGISFLTADSFAKAKGLMPDERRRIESGISYILDTMAYSEGNTCLPKDMLISRSAELLGVSSAMAEDVIRELLSGGILRALPGHDLIYTSRSYLSETTVATKLLSLAKGVRLMSVDSLPAIISSIEATSGMDYEREQREAIYRAVDSGVSVITGGPGTGKTTVIRALLEIYGIMGIKCALAAPTGRAAKRMSEATAYEAKTVHRLLEVEFDEEGTEPKFRRDEKSPLEVGAVIIDEASMLDLSLFESLLRALRAGTRLILIGDCDQLPSVGAGNVLSDIIDSGIIPCVRLKTVFRQAKESLIVRNAHAVNNGEELDLSKTDEDFFFLCRDSEEDIAKTVCDLCARRLPNTYTRYAKDGIQVIAPSRRGAVGTENLNIILREALNPQAEGKNEITVGAVTFREGDRVMQTQNNYELNWTRGGHTGKGVYNGDIGYIKKIEKGTGEISVVFEDRTAYYEKAMISDLEHAYAITVHKSQGSEYPIVVIPAAYYAPSLMSRNMLYTAITRAKKIVVSVGYPSAFTKMVQNASPQVRYSGLAVKLKNFDI